MDIYGTPNGEPLPGTDGDDVIYPEGGLDTVEAGAGNDEIVITVEPTWGTVLDGGADFDTLVLRWQPGFASNAGPNTWGYLFGYPTQITSIEAIRFDSEANTQLYGLLLHPVIEAGLTTVIGGAGSDILLDLVFTPGTYTMADFTLSNWTNDILDPNADYVSLYVNPATIGDFTLIAREGLASVQYLFAGQGNDVLIGSSGSELLAAGRGIDQLYGNAGIDVLRADNLTLAGAAAVTLSFAGDTFDGGADFDYLEVGGAVDLTGATITSIEALRLLGSFPAPGPNGSAREPAQLTLSSQTAAGLAANLAIEGAGTVTVNMTPGTAFNGSGYTFAATADADFTIVGTGANDSITGTSGGDVIVNGGGVDTIRAGDGDDTIVLNAQVGGGSVLDGGNGFDTLLLKTQPGIPSDLGGTSTQYNGYFPTVLGSLEAVQYDSQAGDTLSLVVLEPQRAAAGLTTLIGGAGRDLFYDVVFQPGTYTMPALTFVNWTSTLSDPSCDFVVLFASDPGSHTLNARDNVAVLQALRGNVGDDVLNGSNGSDLLNGAGGINQLYGNDGDDVLYAENPTPYGGVASTLTFAGNIYNGGNGSDTLFVGGLVNFQGTLVSIEAIYFEKAYTSPAPGIDGFDPGHLVMTAATAGGLAANMELRGNGTIEISLGSASFFDASSWTLKADANVTAIFNGSSASDTIIGSVLADAINGDAGDDLLRGRDGADSLYGGAGNDTLYGGFGASSGAQAGDLGDHLEGGDGNDVLRGGDGDDTLLGGADNDNLRGDAGADVLDGGDGFDFASYVFGDLAGPVNVDMRGVTGGSAAQQVADGRGAFDSLSNIEKIGLSGTESNDTLRGSTALQNQLYGFGGNDFIRGGNDVDLIDGGDGNDDIRGNGGSDEIYGGAGNDLLVGGFNPLGAPQPGDGADYIDGGDGNDLIRGGDGNDTLLGGAGDDNLNGNFGDDLIDGGEGDDFIIWRFDDLNQGMTIDFRYVTGGPDAQQVDDQRGGIDTVVNFERLGVFATSGNDVIFGSETLGGQLGGYGGDDVITGGSGSDLLIGDSGSDTLDGGNGYDYADFSGNQAGYAITALSPGQWQVTDIDQSDGDDGTDVLSNIEELQFADGGLVLDLAPYALAGSADGDEDTVIAGTATGSDPDGDPLTYALVTGPAHGTVTFDPSGSYTYTPDADYNGPDSFSFTVSDGTFTSDPATIALTVNPTADAALIGGVMTGLLTEANSPGAPAGQAGGTLTVSDPDGPAQFAAQTASGTYGSFALLADGNWTYTLAEASTAVQALNTGSTVTDSFTVASDDGTTNQVVVTINGANDAAIIGGQTSGTVTEAAALGGASQVSGALTISDVDNPAQFVAGTLTGLYGSLTLTAAGAWTYLLSNTNAAVDGLSAGQSLTDLITVQAADGTQQVLALTIAGANDLRTGTQQADALTGTAGNDTLSGLGGNDQLNGGTGSDTLDGGNGTDTASYAGLGGAVTVSLAITTAQNTGAGGSDTLIAVENLTGTAFADTLSGNAGANTIDGGAGDDTIEGGAGNDALIGGAGIDTASYASAITAVNVSLATTGSQNTGGAGSDTLSLFENLTGSAFADRLTGNSAANVLNGGAGNDRLTGGGGADVLFGGLGDDVFNYAALLDSGPTAPARDLIRDFQGGGVAGGDLIDLSALDAVPSGKDNAFVFIGTAAFHNIVGELRYDTTSVPGQTIVQADTNGDGQADLSIALAWGSESQPLDLVAQDFIL